jgi:hypothetical protein
MIRYLGQIGSPDVLNAAQAGVAGLMGALWWRERRYSRQREDQLTEAHEKILRQREHLQALLEALEGNTRVISEFTVVQGEILRALRGDMARGKSVRGGPLRGGAGAVISG